MSIIFANKGLIMKEGGSVLSCGKNFPGSGPTLVTENGRKVLDARYLKKDTHGMPTESPEEMFERVAREIARVDTQYDGIGAARRAEEEFAELMMGLQFLPNSPTLMNAGKDLGQLSACFVLPIEDSLESIFESVKNAALIHKSGGGTGFSFSRIRPKGNRVRSTHGIASGPVSFMRVFDAATDAVRQGGVRRGANMGVLRVDHPDILDFISAKSCGSDLRNFNISVAVNNVFWEAMKRGDDYVTINPLTQKSSGSLGAMEVFRLICRRAWECGDPGLLFADRVNHDNPTPSLGDFEATNPCGEQPLLPYESCNLGSINLSKMTVWKRDRVVVDYQRLERTVGRAVHFLDNVIDANHYPLPEIEAVTRGNRKIGLGVMGWADMLIQLGIPYDSKPALSLAGKIMGFIQRAAHLASYELAGRRGPYPNFPSSREAGRKNPRPRRNATLTTIAPTGTLSIIAACSSGIEPLFALGYVRKHVLEGKELQELHPGLLRELSERGLDGAELLDQIRKQGSLKGFRTFPEDIVKRYRTAHEISPEWHVRMQAAFQKYSDNGVSKTVNLPFEATPEDVESVYRVAGDLGCKGITVYRDGCRTTQVLNIGCVACA
jgi:ribonucleoside-diphosphate reductase alpha chain